MFFSTKFNMGATGPFPPSPSPWLRGAYRTKFPMTAMLGYRYVSISYLEYCRYPFILVPASQ